MLGLVLLSEIVVVMAALVVVLAPVGVESGAESRVSLFWWSATLSRLAVFLLVALLGGALGGALHAVASLTAHVADGDFNSRWTMWYLTNPFVGAALATVFLSVLNAGLGGQVDVAAPDSIRRTAGLASLSGLFSRHALDKLKQVFDAVVGTPSGTVAGGFTDRAASEGRGLEGPRIQRLDPPRITAASGDRVLLIDGTGFAAGSVVHVAGEQVPARVAAGRISAEIPGRLVDRPSTVPVRVRSAGVWSDPAELEVTA